MARAVTSLPVPDSPRTRTVESCAATWRMRAAIFWIAAEFPSADAHVVSATFEATAATGGWLRWIAALTE